MKLQLYQNKNFNKKCIPEMETVKNKPSWLMKQRQIPTKDRKI